MPAAKGLRNYLKGDASNPKPPGTDGSWSSPSPGPYVGIVKGNIDSTRMGRLKILIPTLAKTRDPHWSQLITCQYLSPFYGAKGVRYTKPHSREYEGTQHSYGFWGVPPDLETRVLVIFAEGNLSQGFWIGCIQDPFTNHMIPGIASSEHTYDKMSGLDTSNPNEMRNAVTPDKQSTYGTKNVPAGELNRAAPGALANEDYDAIPKPIHPFADILLKQGLAADTIRGTTTSSARRESPSQVFGISTPGRKNEGAVIEQLGTKDTDHADQVVRGAGHTFVMDDGDGDGDNQLTRLRTASGHQLLMNDTEGVVYIANGSGNAWIEMSKEGRIDVYSGAGGINLRTEGDFNLHSDANININANKSIRMSASNDKGDGTIVQSADTMYTLGDKGVYTSSQQGPVQTYAAKQISSYAGSYQAHGASGRFDACGSQVHLNSTFASSSWGPKDLTKKSQKIEPRDEGDVELTKKGIEPLLPFTRKTKTTVHRMVTHEPFPRFEAFVSDGTKPPMLGDTGGSLAESALTGISKGANALPPSMRGGATNLTSAASKWSPGKGATSLTDKVKETFAKTQNLVGADNRKAWSKLANTPGTAEFIEQRNRNSPIEAIKVGQYQADAQNYVKEKMGNSTNPVKAKKLLQNYGVHYDETFGLATKADSISTKMQGFSLSDSADAIKNSFSTLSNQVIESVSGKASQMFKDNILVSKSGQLFSIGSSLHGNIGDLKNMKSHVKSLATNVQGLANDQIKGMISEASLGSVVSNVSQVKSTFKNVMAGQVTGITQEISLAQKFGPGDATQNIGKSVHGAGTPVQGAFMSKISSITTRVGSTLSGAVGKFFG